MEANTSTIALVVALLVILSRRLEQARPLWDLLPPKWRWLPPGVVAAAGTVAEFLPRASTWTEIADVALMAGVMLALAAMAGGKAPEDPNAPPKKPGDGGSVPPVITGCFLLLLQFTLGGCAGSFEEARLAGIERTRASENPPVRDVYRCRKLDDRRMAWGAIAASSLTLSGASGITSIPAKDDETQAILIGTSVGLAAAAAGAQLVASHSGEAWARECSSP